MDKEEEAVITLQALADRIEGSRGQPVEAQELKAALVDFHGTSEGGTGCGGGNSVL